MMAIRASLERLFCSEVRFCIFLTHLSEIGPIEAMTLLTAWTIILHSSQGGPISFRLAKILTGRLTLEQMGWQPATIDWAFGVLYGSHRSYNFTDSRNHNIIRVLRGQVGQNTGKSDSGAKRTLPGGSDGNHWALVVLNRTHRSYDFTDNRNHNLIRVQMGSGWPKYWKIWHWSKTDTPRGLWWQALGLVCPVWDP